MCIKYVNLLCYKKGSNKQVKPFADLQNIVKIFRTRFNISHTPINNSQINTQGRTSGGVYVPSIYTHAR